MDGSLLDRDLESHGEPPYQANSWLSHADEYTSSAFPFVNSYGHESPLQEYRALTDSWGAACGSAADNSHMGWPVNNLSDDSPSTQPSSSLAVPAWIGGLASAIDDSLARTAQDGDHTNSDIDKRKADDFNDEDQRILNNQRSKRSRAIKPVSNCSKRSSINDPSTRDEKPEKVTFEHDQQGPPGLTSGVSRLRKACRKATRPPPSPLEPAETAEEHRAKASHNQVEKQYRVRLNLQFERLLATLPSSQADDSHDGDNRALSKAKVLDAARQRIESLESERDLLKRQCSELRVGMGRLRDAAWYRPAGGIGKFEDGE